MWSYTRSKVYFSESRKWLPSCITHHARAVEYAVAFLQMGKTPTSVSLKSETKLSDGETSVIEPRVI